MDDDGLGAFCRTEWPRLVGVISLYLGDRDQAEDVAQETLVRVCLHWRRVRQADSPSAWAHRVAFNLAKSMLRRRVTWRRIRVLAVERDRSTEQPDAVVVAIRDELQRLPVAQREALVLRYYADLSVRDVAQLMGCPENTVKTHTRRALEALRGRGLLDEDTIPDPITEDVG